MNKEIIEITNEEIDYMNSIKYKYNKKTNAELIKKLEIIIEEKGKEINIKNNKLCELKKQLQNCQNEIIRLKASNKNLMSVILKTKRERANKGRQVCQSQNESIKYKKLLDKSEQNQTQLAIAELEKVKDTLKHFCNIHNDEYYGVKSQVKGIEQDVCDQINQQISELKGEKDDKN